MLLRIRAGVWLASWSLAAGAYAADVCGLPAIDLVDVGYHPRSLARGDLDGDGTVDLAVAVAAGVDVRLGRDGTFVDGGRVEVEGLSTRLPRGSRRQRHRRARRPAHRPPRLGAVRAVEECRGPRGR